MAELDRLASVAAQLVARVRDDDPERNGRWLAAVTDERARWSLLFVLAAMVPDDRSVADLLVWIEEPPGGFDTEENVARRRKVLDSALRGARGRFAKRGAA